MDAPLWYQCNKDFNTKSANIFAMLKKGPSMFLVEKQTLLFLFLFFQNKSQIWRFPSSKSPLYVNFRHLNFVRFLKVLLYSWPTIFDDLFCLCDITKKITFLKQTFYRFFGIVNSDFAIWCRNTAEFCGKLILTIEFLPLGWITDNRISHLL